LEQVAQSVLGQPPENAPRRSVQLSARARAAADRASSARTDPARHQSDRERIRATKLSAKNGLFIGHPGAGERSAIIYSIIGSCRRRGIDPLLYLREVLTRLPAMTNRDRRRPLLPSNRSKSATG